MGSAIKETYSEQYVTYTLEMDGKFYIVEHVPARVCRETGNSILPRRRLKNVEDHLGTKKAGQGDRNPCL